MDILKLDFETHDPDTNLSITDAGVNPETYAKHATAFYLSFKFNEDTIQVINLLKDSPHNHPFIKHKDGKRYFIPPNDCMMVAHNLLFDYCVFLKQYLEYHEVDPFSKEFCYLIRDSKHQFYDTAYAVQYLNIEPLVRAKLKELGLDGKAQNRWASLKNLCKYFQIADKGDFPEGNVYEHMVAHGLDGYDEEAMRKYALGDLEAVDSIFGKLWPYFNPEISQLDYRAQRYYFFKNLKGLPIDVEKAKRLKVYAKQIKEKDDKIITELSGGLVTSATQGETLLNLFKQHGYKGPDLSNYHLSNFKKQNPSMEPLIDQYQLHVNCPSLDELIAATQRTGKLTEAYAPCAAKTRRTLSRGFNMQNMPRKQAPEKIENLRHVHHSYRSLIKAPEGQVMLVSDFASVEMRALVSFCNQTNILQDIKDGKDTYSLTALDAFPHLGSVDKVDDEIRSVGKVFVLSGGYEAGFKQLYDHTMIEKYGMEVDRETALKTFHAFKRRFNNYDSFWRFMLESAYLAWNGADTEYLIKRDGYLNLKIPSLGGTSLLPLIDITYERGKLRLPKIRYDYKTKEFKNGKKKKVKSRRIEMAPLKGGRDLTSKLCQSACREVMVYTNELCIQNGLDMFLEVYDEMGALVREDEAEQKAKLMHEIVTSTIPWRLGFEFIQDASYPQILKTYTKI